MMEVKQIAVYGAGGFGREVAWLIEACNTAAQAYEVVCFIDDSQAKQGTVLNGVPLMSLAAARQRFPVARVVGGVGAPSTRQALMEKAAAAGFQFETIVHPRVERSRWLEIGEGTLICAGRCRSTSTAPSVTMSSWATMPLWPRRAYLWLCAPGQAGLHRHRRSGHQRHAGEPHRHWR